MEAPLNGYDAACVALVDQNGISWFPQWYKNAMCIGAVSIPNEQERCSVGAPVPSWDVQFANLERGLFPTAGGQEEKKDITLSCTGSRTHDFNVKLNMTPTSWSSSQLVTSNPMLGVQVTVEGTPAKLGDSFTMRVQGQGSKTLGFSVLRNPSVSGHDIATGDFTASGTLIVSEQ
jgi:minor fimbrial subunit